MKILLINVDSGYGGSTGRITNDIYHFVESCGETPLIAYGREFNYNDNVNAIRVGSKLDVYKHIAISRLFDSHGFGSKRATEKLLLKIKEFQPDIIHLHNIHGYYLNIDVLFKYLENADIPVVWTFHDCWPFTGHCTYFDIAGCEKWKHGCQKCPQKNEYPKSILMDASKKNYVLKKQLFNSVKNMTIVTPSKWLGELVKQSFLSKYPVKVINNGIDLSIFKPTTSDFKSENGIEGKCLVLGVANIWNRRKGLEDILKTAEIVDDKFAFAVVGLTEEQKQELPQNIIGITKTSNVEELVKIYSAADVFVNPTYEDNFPTTNIEALACGTPVITYNTGGSPESVDESCGFVVEPGDVDGMVNALNMLQSIKREDCMKKSSEYNAVNKFNEYLNLYKMILKG